MFESRMHLRRDPRLLYLMVPQANIVSSVSRDANGKRRQRRRGHVRTGNPA
jgi:hypothetical protein